MLPQPHLTTAQKLACGLLGTFMMGAGTGHLTFARHAFQAQVPDWVPQRKDAVVLESGVVEIGVGLALLLARRRRAAVGLGLAALYVLVFPGNVHQYTHRLSALGLDTDAKRLGRLFLQPALVAAALWASGAGQALQRQARRN